MDFEHSELANACLTWFERALPIIGQHQVPMRPSMDFIVRDDGHSGTGTQVPNWEYYVTNERAALIELPETGALLELARMIPALDQVMLHDGSGDAIALDSLRAHIVDSYLTPLTVAVLKRAGEGQTAAFSTVYGQFEKFLFNYKELSFSILVQFSNFRSDVPEVEWELACGFGMRLPRSRPWRCGARWGRAFSGNQCCVNRYRAASLTVVIQLTLIRRLTCF